MSVQKTKKRTAKAATKKAVATNPPVTTAQAQSDESVDEAATKQPEGETKAPLLNGDEAATKQPECETKARLLNADEAATKQLEGETKAPLVNGEANKQEQIIASSAVSKTEGNNNAGEDKESTGMGSDSAAINHGTTSHDGAKSSSATGSELDIATTTDFNTTALGEQVKGAMLVTAKLDAGFWRAGIKFTRLEKTLVLVLAEEENEINGMDVQVEGIDLANVVCVKAEKAKKIHSERNLVVTIVDLDDLTIKVIK